jgi:sulfatase modifying factor 1
MVRNLLFALFTLFLVACQFSSSDDTFTWVEVPGGVFQMGGALSSGTTVMKLTEHEVQIDPFLMTSTEVTVGQYRTFCEATGRTLPPPPPWGWQDSLPMVNVTWQQAKDFCTWAGGRLPTEAEWEYAARGGQAPLELTAEQLNEKAWIQENADGRPQVVGSKQPNELGLYDLLGNVGEWCQDWYQTNYYERSPRENPTGPEQGQFRVVRGGHFQHPAGWVHRPEVRFQGAPLQGKETLGFRVVRDL